MQHASQHRRHIGFSLVEILVGMAVGMLGILVIFQMYSTFERQKRSTTSGDEAQNSGVIALYQLQRNLEHSGFGFSVLDLLGCDVVLRAGVTLTGLAPVTINPATSIIPAGDTNTDTLLVAYGNSNGTPVGDTIRAATGSVYTMRNTPTVLPGDYVLAEPQSAACTGANALTLQQVASIDTTARTVTLTSAVSAFDGSLYNLGQSPKIYAYAIRNGTLTVCDYMTNDCGVDANKNNTSIWVPLASDIASMKAQYGRDSTTPMDAVVDTYDQTAPTTNCGWARVSAVRLALAARGAVRGEVATTTAPTWAGGTINLSANTNWQNYHYKVFENTVPLRNVAWMGVQSGC